MGITGPEGGLAPADSERSGGKPPFPTCQSSPSLSRRLAGKSYGGLDCHIEKLYGRPPWPPLFGEAQFSYERGAATEGPPLQASMR
jgi:hypothetical protein